MKKILEIQNFLATRFVRLVLAGLRSLQKAKDENDLGVFECLIKVKKIFFKKLSFKYI